MEDSLYCASFKLSLLFSTFSSSKEKTLCFELAKFLFIGCIKSL
ncbi:hypothetical protein HAT2_00357 [Candidatus Similichlamydia laticola]|uniref:Uncharacterized protein n=1 Tax=Candidatus Similichlamydia laticola TaxID=2170265 RepID=A0A369KIF7_9BACT|nr:hypothetical protein HAT2_00357 [Candidatus Similichlamydia laticola]